MTNLILAIDRGKDKSVFCRFDGIAKAMAFRTVAMTPTLVRAENGRLDVERVDSTPNGI